MMRNQRLFAVIAALTCLVPGAFAEASSIEFSTRFYAGGPLSSAADYKSVIDGLMSAAPTGGYGNATPASFDGLSNQSVFSGGSNSNIAFRDTVSFNVASAGTWSFRLGPDFGRGGAVYLDNASVSNSTDLWWAGNWGGQILSISANLASGTHTLKIYGLEDCCDGGQSLQFSTDGVNYRTVSTTDGVSPVPLPGALPLFASALLGVGIMSRRRREQGVTID